MTLATATTSCTACGKPFQFHAGHSCGETPVERKLRDELAQTQAKLAAAAPTFTHCGKCGAEAATADLIVWRWPSGSSSALCRACSEEIGLLLPEAP
jgi:hypothetical protein